MNVQGQKCNVTQADKTTLMRYTTLMTYLQLVISSLWQRSRLLDIPTELRALILQYLLPDVPFIASPEYQSSYHRSEKNGLCIDRTHRSRPEPRFVKHIQRHNKIHIIQDDDSGPLCPLRYDGAVCWPHVLQLNNQIYREAQHLLYSRSRTFGMHLVSSLTATSICVNSCPLHLYPDAFEQAHLVQQLRMPLKLFLTVEHKDWSQNEVSWSHLKEALHFIAAALLEATSQTNTRKFLTLNLAYTNLTREKDFRMAITYVRYIRPALILLKTAATLQLLIGGLDIEDEELWKPISCKCGQRHKDQSVMCDQLCLWSFRQILISASPIL